MYTLVIGGATPRGFTDVIGQRRSLLGVGRECIDNVHPVKGMQMIEVNDMIVLILGTMQQVAEQACIFRNLDANRVFDCPHRGQRVNKRSDPA